jgi:hypothetical protein
MHYLGTMIGVLSVGLVQAAPADAQAERAGVVAALTGQASVVRAKAPEPAPLRFKDDVYLNDRIATGEDSTARLLLGERALVTVRERSMLTLTALPGKAVANLTRGDLAIAVVKQKMRPGDTIEIKTPNAVVAIRGTVVVAEVTPADGRGRPDESVISVLRGRVEIVQLDPASGQPLRAPMMLDALQSLAFTGTQTPQLRTLQPDTARRVAGRYTMPLAQKPSPIQASIVESQREKTARQVDALLRGQPSALAPTTSALQGGSATTGSTLAAPSVSTSLSGTLSISSTSGTSTTLSGSLSGATKIVQTTTLTPVLPLDSRSGTSGGTSGAPK